MAWVLCTLAGVLLMAALCFIGLLVVACGAYDKAKEVGKWDE